jgi:hypothetical protein
MNEVFTQIEQTLCRTQNLKREKFLKAQGRPMGGPASRLPSKRLPAHHP